MFVDFFKFHDAVYISLSCLVQLCFQDLSPRSAAVELFLQACNKLSVLLHFPL